MRDLQIHDEVILEGPAETAERALALVKGVMSRPTQAIGEKMQVLNPRSLTRVE